MHSLFMNFFKSKPWLTGILIGASLGILIYWFVGRDSDAVRQLKVLERGPRMLREYQESEVEKIRYEMSEAGTKRIVGELTFEQKLALLRDKWSKHIDKGYMQVKMLEEIMNLCKKERPNDWVACTNELAGAAFPQLGDKLFSQLSSLVRYNDWLSRNKEKLDKMSRKERQKLLNEMRGKLFGDENAKEIWANELRVEAVRNTLDDMKEAKGKDLSTKLSAFKATLNEAFTGTTANQDIDLPGWVNVAVQGNRGANVRWESVNRVTYLKLVCLIGFDNQMLLAVPHFQSIRNIEYVATSARGWIRCNCFVTQIERQSVRTAAADDA